MVGISAVSSKSRIATFSPREVGIVATLKSISLPPTSTLKRPSWGIRFSSILRLERILIRETTEEWISSGRVSRSCNTPSALSQRPDPPLAQRLPVFVLDGLQNNFRRRDVGLNLQTAPPFQKTDH